MSRKTLYTLCINDYAPRIRQLTFPLLQAYAKKIGADFKVITERCYPEMPVTFEKFQVAEMADRYGDEWSLFFDADTLISPEMFDVTNFLNKDTVAHNGKDLANVRFKYDEYFLRDGRHIGSCTWCVIASEWCVQDLWTRPNLQEWWVDGAPAGTQNAAKLADKIQPTIGEFNSGHCSAEHLIDDYLLSRNIARFGLKFTTVEDICAGLGIRRPDGRGISPYLYHIYNIAEETKLKRMLAVLSTPAHTPAFEEDGEHGNGPNGPVVRTRDGRILEPCGVGWELMKPADANAYREEWGWRVK